MLFGALFFALAAETGCTKETLDHYKNEGFVDIELAWPEGAAPKGTRVLFYPVAADGKAVAAAEGEQVLTYQSFECPADGQRIDVVTVQFRERIEVKAQPKACVKTVILRFKVEGDDLIALDGGTFSGVSPSHHCATAKCATTSESVNFPTDRVTDNSGYNYKAEISVLDLIKPNSGFGTHTVRLNVVPNGGDPYTVTADVTKVVDQFFKDNGGTIPVTIPVEVGIELKKIGGVLTAEVTDWIPGTGGGTIGDPVENEVQ